MERRVSVYRPDLATQLEPDHSVFRLSARDTPDHLHHQCHRVGKHEPLENH